MGSNPSTAMEFGQYRVMVLEDNELQRALLVASLRGMGVGHVAEAASGDEALALLAESEDGFDTVFCDLQIEDSEAMDGIEFIREAQTFRIGGLVLVSALDEDLFACAEMLAYAYGLPLIGRLSKPVSSHKLRDILINNPISHKKVPDGTRTLPSQRAWTKSDLRQALRREEFVPHFQPKILLSTGEFAGVEALARWQHPDKGILPPFQFIELMEQEGLIDELTEQLYRKLLVAIQQWKAQGVEVKTAFNVSSLTLQNIQIPNRWRAIAEEHRVNTGMLTVELTESALAQKFHGLLESLTRLRMHGFSVSLDDFGTGYASLQQLCNIPVTEVKIDRSFVATASQRPRTALVMESMISLAKKLSLQIVAEGIETPEDADFLRKAGCDIAQGFYYSRPIPPEALIPWIVGAGRMPGSQSN